MPALPSGRTVRPRVAALALLLAAGCAPDAFRPTRRGPRATASPCAAASACPCA